MTKVARAFSVLLHPLFLTSYMLLLMISTNPYLFGFTTPLSKGLVLISVITISMMFPLLAIVLMKMLGFIEKLEMEDKKERIGPLIASGLFYMWLYINIRKNDFIPDVFSAFVLGTTMAMFVALIITNFSKISLHTIGAGGFLMAILLVFFHLSSGNLNLVFNVGDTNITISERLIIMITVLLAGVIGSSRLKLGAHQPDEIFGGYIVGILCQIIAFRYFL